jgi:hypothetical protein
MDLTRKLASIRRIDKIEPIEGADKIVKATVGGWQLVTAIDNGFKEGDLVIYMEIDSWIPTELAPFLSKGKEPREFNGVKGEKLRTIRMRGQISQGLLLPLESVGYTGSLADGTDLTEMLGIQKWEAPVNAQLAGMARGNFPSFIRKTDQERCLSGDTLVLTEHGNIPIREICESTSDIKVASFNHTDNNVEFKAILSRSIMTRRKGWLEVTTKSGKIVKMTKNHRVWVDDLDCYRLAEELKIGNILKIYQKD